MELSYYTAKLALAAKDQVFSLLFLYLSKVSHVINGKKILVQLIHFPIVMFIANDSCHATLSEKERKATISFSTCSA